MRLRREISRRRCPTLNCAFAMTFRPAAGQPLRLMRGRWFFFADGPNARGVIRAGLPRMIRALPKHSA